MKNTLKILMMICLAMGLVAVMAAPAAAELKSKHAGGLIGGNSEDQARVYGELSCNGQPGCDSPESPMIDDQNIPEADRNIPDGGDDNVGTSNNNDNQQVPDDEIDEDTPPSTNTVPETPPPEHRIPQTETQLPNTGTQLLLFAGAGIFVFLVALVARKTIGKRVF